VRDRFTTTRDAAIAYAWFVQATQTLAPRWFVAAREEGVSAPLRTATPPDQRTAFNTAEITAGFRVTPEVTLRSSYFTRRLFGLVDRDHQVAVSIVWAHRWW